MIIGHQKQWDFFKKNFEVGQLSHAYLFSGQDQIGKKTFAIEFLKFMNCLPQQAGQGADKPCGKCVNCKMIEKNSFPDLLLIKNKEDKNEIEILQIREAQNFLSYKPYYGDFKAVIIDGAEKMNQEAQSCFLKTLEEPKGKTILFLITSMPDMMLPTIFSRCQQVKFFKPKDLPENAEKKEKEQEILKELVPVLKSDFAEKFKYVKSIDFEKQKVGDILQAMQKHLRHLLMVKIGTEKPSAKDADFKNYSIQDFNKMLNLIEDINKKLIFTNASQKLALEILLMEV